MLTALIVSVLYVSALFAGVWLAQGEIPKRRLFRVLWKFHDTPFTFEYKGKQFTIEYKIDDQDICLYTIGRIIINNEEAADVAKLYHVFFDSRAINYHYPESEVNKLVKVASREYRKQSYKEFTEKEAEHTLFK